MTDCDKLVGTHFIGPTWQGNDASSAAAAQVPGATVDASAVPGSARGEYMGAHQRRRAVGDCSWSRAKERATLADDASNTGGLVGDVTIVAELRCANGSVR